MPSSGNGLNLKGQAAPAPPSSLEQTIKMNSTYQESKALVCVGQKSESVQGISSSSRALKHKDTSAYRPCSPRAVKHMRPQQTTPRGSFPAGSVPGKVPTLQEERSSSVSHLTTLTWTVKHHENKTKISADSGWVTKLSAVGQSVSLSCFHCP